MLVLIPHIFIRYPEVISGVSTKIGAGRPAPYFFNTSFSVGDDKNTVKENRNLFFENLGISEESVAYQRQVHEDKISFVTKGGLIGESDAMITNKPGIGLAVSVADCVPVLLYDPVKKVIAAVHSGWRGTQKRILLETLDRLKEYGCIIENLVAYIGPSVSKNVYEVGREVAELFNKKYIDEREHKFYLDVAGVNLDILLESGIRKSNLQNSKLCTFAMKDIFHSYRRDGKKSGRSLLLIAMKEPD